MPIVAELLCEFCLRSVTAASPIREKDELVRDSIVATPCRHLMHSSCVDYAFLKTTEEGSNTVTCRHPECGNVIERNQILILDVRIKNCIKEATDETIHELTTRLAVANDMTGQYEASAKQYAALAAQAEKKVIQIEVKFAEADKRYKKLLEDVANQRVGYVSHSRNPSVPLPTVQPNDAPKTVIRPLPRYIQTPPKSAYKTLNTASGRVTAAQNRPVVRVERMEMPRRATASNEEGLKIDTTHTFSQIRPLMSYADFANQNGDVGLGAFKIPEVPKNQGKKLSSQYANAAHKGTKHTTGMSMKSPSFHHLANNAPPHQLYGQKKVVFEKPLLLRPAKDATQHQLHGKRKAAFEKPVSVLAPRTISKKHWPMLPNTTSDRSIDHHQAGVRSGYSRSAYDYRGVLTNPSPDTEVIAEESLPPAAKRTKESFAKLGRNQKRFCKRFGTTSDALLPFYPLNAYPHRFTAAGIQDANNVHTVGIFAYDILLIGDGHATGIANYVVNERLFKDNLNTDLYKRDLSIVDLIATLNTFTTLPARIMLSIGNWDATRKMPYKHFFNHFNSLIQIFRDRRVSILYILPVITHPNMDPNRESITCAFDINWGKTFGGEYVMLSQMVSDAFKGLNDQCLIIDELGPMFEMDLYAPLVEAIRDRFIPEVPTNVSNDEEDSFRDRYQLAVEGQQYKETVNE